MGLKRKDVEETVKEHRADELSSMFNMLIDKKLRDKGEYCIKPTVNGCNMYHSLELDENILVPHAACTIALCRFSLHLTMK